jgi:hypothetical protein
MHNQAQTQAKQALTDLHAMTAMRGRSRVCSHTFDSQPSSQLLKRQLITSR